MTIKKRSGRQEVVSGELEFPFSDVDGTAFNGVVELPDGARVISGEFEVIEAADAGTTVNVGDSEDGDRYKAAIDCTATGVTALDPTGLVMSEIGDVGATFNQAMTQGKFKLSVQYVVKGRVAFSQGLDYRGEGIRGA